MCGVDQILDRLFLDRALVERALASMRQHLVRAGDFRFSDSPEDEIYAFATPFFIPEALHAELEGWTNAIVQALEREARLLRGNPEEADRTLSFASELDRELFLQGGLSEESLPIHRLDFAIEENGRPRLMEVNCGCPGGELDPALVAEAFMASPFMREVEGRLQQLSKGARLAPYQDPRDESLAKIMRCYEAFRRDHQRLPRKPTIALVTTSAQARFMIPECRGIARHYESLGYRTLVGDLLELEVRGEEVMLRGQTIHLIFRKFSTESFRRRLMDFESFGRRACRGVEALWEATARGLVCMVNPLGSTYLQDKGLLELLGIRYPELGPVLLETHVLEADLPSREPSLWKAIGEGEEFVLKKRRSFGGRHVILEPEKVKALGARIIREEPGKWVAQRRVSIPGYPFSVEDRGRIEVSRFPFTVSLFGRSCFVRVGTTAPHEPINAHGGGAATCGLVLLGANPSG
jgi:hypothetical protein